MPTPQTAPIGAICNELISLERTVAHLWVFDSGPGTIEDRQEYRRGLWAAIRLARRRIVRRSWGFSPRLVRSQDRAHARAVIRDIDTLAARLAAQRSA